MSDSIKHTITFTPMQNFFFGKENLQPNGTVNYFMHGSTLPQQTTIIGALRYYLLLNADDETFENNKIKDDGNAQKLIGKKSFCMDDAELNLGNIKRISPVFLIKDKNTKLIPAPFWTDEKNILEYSETLQTAILPDYSAKKDYPKQYTDGTILINEDEIFEEFVQTNNQKKKTEDSFFKTQSYRFKNDYCFAVEVELNNDVSLHQKYMKIGGENRLFRVEILNEKSELKTDEELLKAYTHPSLHKVVLTSDAYVKKFDKDNSIFAYLKTKDFRQLKSATSANTKYYNRSNKDKQAVDDSNLLQLIENGSVFYFKEQQLATNFADQFKSDNLQHAGFNKCYILSPKN